MRSWSEVGSRVWCDMYGSFVHSEDNSGALNDSQSYLQDHIPPSFLKPKKHGMATRLYYKLEVSNNFSLSMLYSV